MTSVMFLQKDYVNDIVLRLASGLDFVKKINQVLSP